MNQPIRIKTLSSFLLAWMFYIIPTAAIASNPIGTTLCAVIGWFTTGNVGVGIASICIFIGAIAALMNKITWGIFIIGCIDVVILFSAGWFVTAFGGVTCP
jgi:type IV secretory pathway VirB2 component (pilin)